MPRTIGKCKLFRIKPITLLEGETFLRNKYKTEFFEIKCTFFGRKENTISYWLKYVHLIQGVATVILYFIMILLNFLFKVHNSC